MPVSAKVFILNGFNLLLQEIFALLLVYILAPPPRRRAAAGQSEIHRYILLTGLFSFTGIAHAFTGFQMIFLFSLSLLPEAESECRVL